MVHVNMGQRKPWDEWRQCRFKHLQAVLPSCHSFDRRIPCFAGRGYPCIHNLQDNHRGCMLKFRMLRSAKACRTYRRPHVQARRLRSRTLGRRDMRRLCKLNADVLLHAWRPRAFGDRPTFRPGPPRNMETRPGPNARYTHFAKLRNIQKMTWALLEVLLLTSVCRVKASKFRRSNAHQYRRSHEQSVQTYVGLRRSCSRRPCHLGTTHHQCKLNTAETKVLGKNRGELFGETL